jgi:hypothetical protein
MHNEVAAGQIHIEQLEIFDRVGISEKERATPQRRTIWFSLDTKRCGWYFSA